MTGFVTIQKRENLSVRFQAIATCVAIAGAVVLPQICHIAGRAMGAGTALGEILLPMHLPILLVGLLAGPYAGAFAGLLGPAVSFALSGMPAIGALPFMMAELLGYGLTAGLLRSRKMPVIGKVLTSMVAGRLLRFAAVLFATCVIGFSGMAAASVWIAVEKGIVGIILQLLLIPMIVKIVEKDSHR